MKKKRLEILQQVWNRTLTIEEAEKKLSELKEVTHCESYNPSPSPETDDYEFSLFSRWKDEDGKDDYDGGIKHFQD